MSKIIGLDLGTNSIGWAIRDTDTLEENQIIDKGVIVFKKGVGNDKSGEFSLAAERRKNRSKRRLYNAKRYRKWALLQVLMENGMCPISENELKLWSIGNWQKNKKNKGRVYPTGNDFKAWLAMDFDKIGKIYNENEKLKPQFENPYLLRTYLLKNLLNTNQITKYQIGRSLYHLVQRRGFKTSRKSGKSNYAKNEEFEILKLENPDIHISQVLQQKLQNDGKRIRGSGVIQRKYFEDEFYALCKKQGIGESLTEKLHKAIYFVRPLRSQKGLVGNCTLEIGKPRIPVSHPKFEEFRALSFINNLQWRLVDTRNYETLPLEIKKKVLEEVFFRRKKDGQFDNRSHFKFEEIIKKFSENGKLEFNYKNLPNVSCCPVIADIMNTFDHIWENKFITTENKYGINWDSLSLTYKVKYGKNIDKIRNINFEGIWHLLFDYIQTKDKKEGLQKFCENVLGWEKEKVDIFSEIDIQQGYGSLSYSAINKILPYLQEGFIYSEAVSFANLKKIFGDSFNENKEEAQKLIAYTITKISDLKEKLNIVNGIIQQYFSESTNLRAKGVDNHIKEMAYEETVKKLKGYFSEEEWNSQSDKFKSDFIDFVLNKYLNFLDGKQLKSEKASSNLNKNPEIDYYKLPRLDEALKSELKTRFGLSDDNLKNLYHPSDIEIYPKSKTNKLQNPQPPSKAWKNPMALRTMHELKKLINYLLEEGKIDTETKVVVEMARELNDANRRWAIKTYQKNREDENIEFAKAIVGVAKEKYSNLDENNAENISKVRLWWEQLENGDELYKQIRALKEDVQKYRLWREQECQCMYTGETISLTDLFDSTQTHFEHTFPLSDSFDNSFSNLTVCKAFYNTNIKKDQIPTQLKNYNVNWNGYTAIEPRLKKWREKVAHLKNLIEENKIRTRKTQDPETKKTLIQRRHLLQFDFQYWDKKLKTFTLEKIPDVWKNSQLVDNQIITKYSRAYLKTVFNRVDVQKGTITAEFRKIFDIMGDEKKDRSRHSHHAIDAAVLTLIPGSAKRDETLRKYYEAVENKLKFYEEPYPGFSISHLIEIDNTIVINHIAHDKTLVKTVKKVKKRGHPEFVKDKLTGKYKLDDSGNKIPKIMQGDTIRGQLHKDTFFGAIKVLERNEEGFAIKDENGKYLLKQQDGSDEIWIVVKKPIADLNIDKDVIVDEVLKKYLKAQLESGIEKHQLTDFNHKPIRHIRCRVKAGVGFLSKEKAIPVKKHSFPSKFKHKRDVLAQNEENYLYLLYEGINEKGKVIRGYQILNLFDIAQLKIRNINKINHIPEFQKIDKNKTELKLKAILKVGDKVIFYKEKKEEITKSNANSRLFEIIKFNEMGTAYLYLQNHNEARRDEELNKISANHFDPNQYQARLELKCNKFNCLIENIDFKISPDGEIKFISSI